MASTAPVRTCVVCRKTDEQCSLLRFVLRDDGQLAADSAGGAPGRGAYCHLSVGCLLHRDAMKKLVRSLARSRGTVGRQPEPASMVDVLQDAVAAPSKERSPEGMRRRAMLKGLLEQSTSGSRELSVKGRRIRL
ncbi:MAG: YlxR family protein [Bdellovibrionales bacterium]|nr:YlxR family protein [Bdellovibrionales bacterium]